MAKTTSLLVFWESFLQGDKRQVPHEQGESVPRPKAPLGSCTYALSTLCVHSFSLHCPAAPRRNPGNADRVRHMLIVCSQLSLISFCISLPHRSTHLIFLSRSLSPLSPPSSGSRTYVVPHQLTNANASANISLACNRVLAIPTSYKLPLIYALTTCSQVPTKRGFMPAVSIACHFSHCVE